MSTERVHNDPPFIDPIPFLEKPFTQIEIGLMPEKPSIDFLKWLPTIANETGLIRIDSKWALIKAGERGVPSWTMPHYSDVLIHSHPEKIEYFLPSPGDIGNCSPISTNLITSLGGITQFESVKDMTPKQAQDIAFDLHLSNPNTDRVYLGYIFLENVKAPYAFTPWEDLNQEKIDKILYS